jgi:hypothetical protein
MCQRRNWLEGRSVGSRFRCSARPYTAGATVGFDIVDVGGQFPSRSRAAAMPPIDTTWLDGAGLAVIETACAGAGDADAHS